MVYLGKGVRRYQGNDMESFSGIVSNFRECCIEPTENFELYEGFETPDGRWLIPFLRIPPPIVLDTGCETAKGREIVEL